ncbi:MAG: Uma2 family endonuclease, partial [Candidatus Bipolaricaulia bacterium]
MAKAAIKFTYEDYKNLPESETERYELLEGELVMVPSPSFEHQRISSHLEFLLYGFVREHNLGVVLDAPFEVVLGKPGEERVVQPDILFVAKERREIIQEEEIRGAPDGPKQLKGLLDTLGWTEED